MRSGTVAVLGTCDVPKSREQMDTKFRGVDSSSGLLGSARVIGQDSGEPYKGQCLRLKVSLSSKLFHWDL